MVLEAIDTAFSEVPFLGAWLLAVTSIVVGSIVLQRTGNVYLSVSIGLLSGVAVGAMFLLLGWISTSVMLTYLGLLAVAQFLR